ncbi:MAG: DNA alkylation repair protein [Mariprofundaceae bacterium]
MPRDIHAALEQLANPERAGALQRFFKTGPGEYGEGDRFHGIRVPEIRKFARRYQDIAMVDVLQLLHSPMHEERLLALLILVLKFNKGSAADRQRIFGLYLANTAHINNWDLVDTTAEHIVGAYLNGKDTAPLYQLAESDYLWERRIAIMATFHFIKQHQFDETLKISALLLSDRHDLIHKATGWMLREIGKRNCQIEEEFLQLYYKQMPRTMLRYAIERFPKDQRKAYLEGNI